MANETQVNIIRGTIGSLQEYKVGTDWQTYQERLEQYFLANYIPADREVAVLLTVIGDQAYEVVKGLCDPLLPKDKTFVDLCKLLKSQFSKKVSVFKERIEFYGIKQMENESIKEFFVRIKNKAIECKFGAMLNEVLKDMLLAGLRRGPVLNRVCEEDHTISLNDLIEVALKKEATMEHSSVAINKM